MGAYAVMLREHEGRVEVLLSRLSARVSRTELWTLPGGGIDHGEDPRLAVIREIREETGLGLNARGTVVANRVESGTITVEIASQQTTLAHSVAERLRVA